MRTPQKMLLVGLMTAMVAGFAVFIAMETKNRDVAANHLRSAECHRKIIERFDADELVGRPVALIADCLQFADRTIHYDTGAVAYSFLHPTKSNQEGPAIYRIIIDAQGESVVDGLIYYPEW